MIVAGADGTVRSWNYVESKTSSQRVKESNTKTVWDKKQTRPLHETAGAKAAGLYQPAPDEGYKFLNLPASAEDFSFSEDGRWIVVADADHVAKVWDATEISPQRLIAHLALDQPLKSIAVSHTGEHIAAVAGDGIVYLWKLNGDRGDFSDLSLLQVQGTYLITHNALQNNIFLGSSKIIDTRTQTIVAAFPDYGPGRDSQYRPLSISRDGSLIAGMGREGVMTVNEFSDGKIGKERWKGRFEDTSLYPTSFGFSRDDRYLMGAVGDPGKIAVWDLSKPGRPIRTHPVAGGTAYDAIPGTQQVYIVVPNKETQVFDAVTGRNLQVAWAKHDFAALDMSPDGKSVAGAEVDKVCTSPPETGQDGRSSQATAARQRPLSTVRLLNAQDGGQRNQIELMDYCVQSLNISADSRYLLVIAATGFTAESRTVLQLWDLHSKQPIKTAEIRNGAEILDADLTADSRELVLLDHNRLIVTPWQEKDLVQELCTRLIPNQSEKKEYLELCPNPSQPPTW